MLPEAQPLLRQQCLFQSSGRLPHLAGVLELSAPLQSAQVRYRSYSDEDHTYWYLWLLIAICRSLVLRIHVIILPRRLPSSLRLPQNILNILSLGMDAVIQLSRR
jgi:hypothetical protein